MRCPFLQETLVRFCEVAPFRKMIPRTAGPAAPGPCSSLDFVRCPWAAGRAEARAGGPTCPFLCESLVMHCGAEATSRFVPYSEAIPSCCQTEAYRYCDLYLTMADPDRATDLPTQPGDAGSDGIEMPLHLWYSRNHMWIDVTDETSLQIGADAFLARVIGQAEQVNFITHRDTHRPEAVISVRGADLHLVFPNRVELTGTNVLLKVEPQRLVRDPYGRGWLFAGRETSLRIAGRPRASCLGLLHGPEAAEWMRLEEERLNRHVHEQIGSADPHLGALMSDGGSFAPGLARHLDRDAQLRLFDQFFPATLEGGSGR